MRANAAFSFSACATVACLSVLSRMIAVAALRTAATRIPARSMSAMLRAADPGGTSTVRKPSAAMCAGLALFEPACGACAQPVMTAIAKIVETAAVFLMSPPRARITPREPAPKSKKPGFPGSLDPAKTRLAPRSDLDRLDVRSRRAFRAFDDVEADLLVLFKRLVAFHLDVAVVGEQVLAAVVRRDEPETLGVVEPLHFACSHLLPILSLVTRRIRAPLRARYSRGEWTATTR